MNISIIGATGYSGLELIRLLHNHAYSKIVSIHSQSQAGQNISDVYPHLKGIMDLTLEPINPTLIMEKADVVIFATPSGITSQWINKFYDNNFPVIDVSGDLRLKDTNEYEKWYKKSSAPQNVIDDFIYGLAEFTDYSKNKFISNPGCYATAALLSVAPLIMDDLVEENSLIFDGKSGFSGAGKQPTELNNFSVANDNMTTYKVNSHQHIPEIVQQLKNWNSNVNAIQFSTTLIPVTRGIFMTTYATAKTTMSENELYDVYQNCYKNKPFVRVQPLGEFPSLKQVIGTNYCDIGISYNAESNKLMIITVIDNLIKGAAGQAIQNLNIMFGLEETTGLDLVPVFP